jgi:orotate phosphoribosyltransferase
MTEIDFNDVQTAIRMARRHSEDAARIARMRQFVLAAGLAAGGIIVIAAVLMARLI